MAEKKGKRKGKKKKIAAGSRSAPSTLKTAPKKKSAKRKPVSSLPTFRRGKRKSPRRKKKKVKNPPPMELLHLRISQRLSRRTFSYFKPIFKPSWTSRIEQLYLVRVAEPWTITEFELIILNCAIEVIKWYFITSNSIT